MVIAPNTTIKFVNVPIEIDNKNQINFASKQAQLNYFNSIPNIITITGCTYQRKDGYVRVPRSFDTLQTYNYCFYQNTSYSEKWFFAFVERLEFSSTDMTYVYIKTDVWQTYMFDITLKKSFVEREHVNDDTIGSNTIPENLETGEYIVNSKEYDTSLDSLVYVIQCTEWSTTSDNPPLAFNYGGIFYAGGAYVCDTIIQVTNILQAFANRGKSDAVYNVYMIPSSIISRDPDPNVLKFPGQTDPITLTKTINKVTTLNGYTPVNNKVKCFPYNYMVISNNNGSSNILHYERFSGSTCNFTIKGVPTVGGSVKLIPTNYDTNNDEEEGLLAGKFPTLNWANDEFINWLTQNSVNIGLGVASSGVTLLGGLGMMATGAGSLAGAGSVVSGALGIANTLGAVYQHSFQPNSARGNVNGGDINVCSNKNGFSFYHYSIKAEYAQVIDNYFTMYGYKVNRLKIPNVTGRTNWNYVKTLECNITGSLPETAVEELKSIFNNGVTFWHNPTTFLDYSQTNSIVT